MFPPPLFAYGVLVGEYAVFWNLELPSLCNELNVVHNSLANQNHRTRYFAGNSIGFTQTSRLDIRAGGAIDAQGPQP